MKTLKTRGVGGVGRVAAGEGRSRRYTSMMKSESRMMLIGEAMVALYNCSVLVGMFLVAWWACAYTCAAGGTLEAFIVVAAT